MVGIKPRYSLSLIAKTSFPVVDIYIYMYITLLITHTYACLLRVMAVLNQLHGYPHAASMC